MAAPDEQPFDPVAGDGAKDIAGERRDPGDGPIHGGLPPLEHRELRRIRGASRDNAPAALRRRDLRASGLAA